MNETKPKTKKLNYTHIKLYKSARLLLKTATELSAIFPREHRYTIGQDLHKNIIEFMVMLYEAYNTPNFKLQAERILKLRKQLERVNIYIRLCCDIHLISKERYMEFSKYTSEMEQQSRGWYLSCNKKASVKEINNQKAQNVSA